MKPLGCCVDGVYVLSDKCETRNSILAWRLHLCSLERTRMITPEEARRVSEAAERKASEITQPVNIAVVDEGATWFRTPAWTAPGSAASISPLTRPTLPVPSTF